MSKMKSTFEFVGITKCEVWKNMAVRRQQAKAKKTGERKNKRGRNLLNQRIKELNPI